MAVDPFTSDEEKKRRRTLFREKNPTLAAIGMGLSRNLGAGYGLARGLGDAVGAPIETGGVIGAGGGGGRDAPLPADAVVVPTAPDPTYPKLETSYADQGRRDPRKYGLTRIVKNPDGSYTDMPSHMQRGGEERFYSEYGTRADVDMTGQQFSAPAADPREYFDRENAAAVNLMTDDAAMLRAMETGKRSLDFKARGLERFESDRAKRELAQLDPAQRTSLMIAQMTEGGRNSRAAETNAIALRGQNLDHTEAMTNAERQALQVQMNENARIEEMFADNPEAAIRVAMGRLENLSPTERAEVLSDPNDPRGAMARKLITQQLAEQQGLGANFDPAAVTDANWLNRLFGGRYQTNDGIFGGAGFDPSEAGIRDEDMEAIIRATTIQRTRK